MNRRGGALLLLLAASAARLAAGPSPGAPVTDYAQIGALDQAAGRAALARFRQAGLPPGYFEFTLRILPRRADERDLSGRLWVERAADGPVFRLVLSPGAADEVRWLIRGGEHPAVWKLDRGGAAQPAPSTEPLAPGAIIAPFDLQMPFLSWPDETLVSVNRKLNRPANTFLFRPPAGFARANPSVGSVRAYFDTQFDAPDEIDVFAPNGEPARTLSVVELKKIGEAYVPNQLDVRDEATRDKTRLEVTAAALDLDLPSSYFQPEGLSGPIGAPAARLQRLGN
ncbi:MAG TPA: outer membrane lipoprotein-sorting protein [Opitutaceae bacterium]|nr:outer membrane lipoprotein-sorting protein [Opitutaceae bacterium]